MNKLQTMLFPMPKQVQMGKGCLSLNQVALEVTADTHTAACAGALIEKKLQALGVSICEKAERLAVNDIIISHSEYLGIADICLENSMRETVKYRADAVILATPAGSTAYALSSGGPIISHNLDSITATPVSPHSFFNRSIVYSADEELKVSNIGNTLLKVSVDGRLFDSLENGDYCIIKKSDKRFKMLTFSANNMFATLFNKLKILSNIE